MKRLKLWLLFIGLCHFCTLSLNAQNADTISDSTQIDSSQFIVDVNSTHTDVKPLEIVVDSSIINLSLGIRHLVNFCDETGNNGDLSSSVVAFIDKNGYYYQVSDANFKENIATINSPLSKITKLRGVEYNHKATKGANDTKPNEATQASPLKYGFLAQELESIIPEAVETGGTGKKFINYQAMIPFLVEALKEQQEYIEKQDLKLELLEKHIQSIEKSIKLK